MTNREVVKNIISYLNLKIKFDIGRVTKADMSVASGDVFTHVQLRCSLRVIDISETAIYIYSLICAFTI